MKKNDEFKYYTTLILAFILGLIAIFAFSDNSRVAGSCSINNIELVDVSPNDCWIEDINNTFCPIPHDISCQGDISGFRTLLTQIALEH